MQQLGGALFDALFEGDLRACLAMSRREAEQQESGLRLKLHATGLPIDAAVAESRKAISFSRIDTVEWGTPVLFTRSPNGVLFELDAVDARSDADRRAKDEADRLALEEDRRLAAKADPHANEETDPQAEAKADRQAKKVSRGGGLAASRLPPAAPSSGAPAPARRWHVAALAAAGARAIVAIAILSVVLLSGGMNASRHRLRPVPRPTPRRLPMRRPAPRRRR